MPGIGEIRLEDGGHPAVLVTVTTAVVTYRLATELVEVEDTDGPYQYVPGVAGLGELETEVDLFRLESSVVDSLTLRLVLPDGVDAAARDHAFYALSAATVEVATLYPGQPWRLRDVILDGRVTGLKLGRGDEPTELRVETRAPEGGDSLVDPDRDIGATYPTVGSSGALPALDGKAYPVVVGRCYGAYVYRLGQAHTVGVHTGVLAGHHLAPDVSLSDLTFYTKGASTTMGGTGTLYNGDDDDGNPMAWVEVSTSYMSPTGTASTDTEPYTVDFTQGGVPCYRDPSRAAIGAGEVLEWLLANSGVDVDFDAQARTTSLLSGWDIGVYLDRVDRSLDVIRRRVVPFLPLVERWSPRGLWYQFADPRLAEPEWRLTLGQEAWETPGEIEVVGLDVVNEFVLEHSYDTITSAYAGRMTYGAADSETCRYSQQVYGVRLAPVDRCTISRHEPTLRRMLQYRAERLALPRRLVEVVVDPTLARSLRYGTVGLVTSEDRGWTNLRAVMRQWRVVGTPWVAVLELVDGPPVWRL